jgi:dsDNA-binding SOS-regulon protein
MGRLREKLQKKVKAVAHKVYCCALCGQENFLTVEEFRSHMERDHNDYVFNRSDTTNHQVTELKDLLMTMKDKEIEMMSMFLKANKDMQTEKLEKEFNT